MSTPTEVTPDGYDTVIHTNLLGMLIAVPFSFAPSTSHPGPFYLTQLLLPLLISTAQVRPDRQARIVNLTSSVHHLVESLDFNTFHDGPERRSRAGSSFLYCQSKFVGVRMNLRASTNL